MGFADLIVPGSLLSCAFLYIWPDVRSALKDEPRSDEVNRRSPREAPQTKTRSPVMKRGNQFAVLARNQPEELPSVNCDSESSSESEDCTMREEKRRARKKRAKKRAAMCSESATSSNVAETHEDAGVPNGSATKDADDAIVLIEGIRAGAGAQFVRERIAALGMSVSEKTCVAGKESTVLHEIAEHMRGPTALAAIDTFPESAVSMEVEVNGMTPLMMATAVGCAEVVKKLLEVGHRVESCNTAGWTALHFAAAKGRHPVVKILLEHEACPLSVPNSSRAVPIHLATSQNMAEAALLLAKAMSNEDLGVFDGTGRTALHHCCASASMFLVAEELAKRQVDRIDLPDTTGQQETPLHVATRNNVTETALLFLELGANPVFPDAAQTTPLHLAAAADNEPLLSKMIAAAAQGGHSIDARDRDGYTPLHVAVRRASVRCVAKLLDAGCDVNAKSASGATGIHMAVQADGPEAKDVLVQLLKHPRLRVHVVDEDGRTPLFVSCRSGFEFAAVELLKLDEPIFQCALSRDGVTAMHHAATKFSAETLSFFLSEGCPFNFTDRQQRLPLHWAAEAGALDGVRVILEHVIKEMGRDAVHQTDESGRTALHWCCLGGASASDCGRHTECADILIDAGAKLAARDSFGSSAKDLAMGTGIVLKSPSADSSKESKGKGRKKYRR